MINKIPLQLDVRLFILLFLILKTSTLFILDLKASDEFSGCAKALTDLQKLKGGLSPASSCSSSLNTKCLDLASKPTSDKIENNLYAVHATDFFPKEGFISSGNPSTSFRPTIHWSLGELVRPHEDQRYSWEKKKYGVVVPLKKLTPQLLNVNTYDTFTLGGVKLDQDAVILVEEGKDISQEKLPNTIKIIRYPKSKSLRSAIDEYISAVGCSLQMEETAKKEGRAYLQGNNINTLKFFSEYLKKYPHISFGDHLKSDIGTASRFGQLDQGIQYIKDHLNVSTKEEMEDNNAAMNFLIKKIEELLLSEKAPYPFPKKSLEDLMQKISKIKSDLDNLNKSYATNPYRTQSMYNSPFPPPPYTFERSPFFNYFSRDDLKDFLAQKDLGSQSSKEKTKLLLSTRDKRDNMDRFNYLQRELLNNGVSKSPEEFQEFLTLFNTFDDLEKTTKLNNLYISLKRDPPHQFELFYKLLQDIEKNSKNIIKDGELIGIKMNLKEIHSFNDLIRLNKSFAPLFEKNDNLLKGYDSDLLKIVRIWEPNLFTDIDKREQIDINKFQSISDAKAKVNNRIVTGELKEFLDEATSRPLSSVRDQFSGQPMGKYEKIRNLSTKENYEKLADYFGSRFGDKMKEAFKSRYKSEEKFWNQERSFLDAFKELKNMSAP